MWNCCKQLKWKKDIPKRPQDEGLRSPLEASTLWIELLYNVCMCSIRMSYGVRHVYAMEQPLPRWKGSSYHNRKGENCAWSCTQGNRGTSSPQHFSPHPSQPSCSGNKNGFYLVPSKKAEIEEEGKSRIQVIIQNDYDVSSKVRNETCKVRVGARKSLSFLALVF